MNQYYWDTRVDYLLATRWSFINDDYIEFLISKVWKFDKPVNIVDFGCGAGHLGLRFLPLLPEGSKYTGIDKGEALLQKAKVLFAPLPYDVEFIHKDLYELELNARYDAAICFAVLMHLEDSKAVLKKMIEAVNPGGKVICFEAHRNAATVNAYIDGLTPNQMSDPTLLQKLRELDRLSIKKDGNIGIKMPVYMRELGLQDIGCRVSDRVNYLHPTLTKEEKNRLYSLFQYEHFGTGVADEAAFVAALMERGLTEEEAQRQLQIEQFLSDWFLKNGMESDSVVAPSLMISYGTKAI